MRQATAVKIRPFTPEQITTCERIAALMTKHIRNQLTDQEREELHEWVGGSEKRIKLFEEISDPEKIEKALALFNSK
jgi:hypothetical protein